MSRIAIITARGGSKRIPKKNIKDFCGRPIISYSIETAINSGLFDEVMVSTDSIEIADLAKKYGASVPFMRSEENSNDFAKTADVVMEVLDNYKKMGKSFDVHACIYPTAPFISIEKLTEGIRILEDNEGFQVMPVVEFSFPPLRGCVVNENGYLSYKWEEYRLKRSQDLEPIFHDAGQFYIYRTDKYIEGKGVITDRIFPLILSELEVQDIDNETDWKLAELKYRLIKGM